MFVLRILFCPQVLPSEFAGRHRRPRHSCGRQAARWERVWHCGGPTSWRDGFHAVRAGHRQRRADDSHMQQAAYRGVAVCRRPTHALPARRAEEVCSCIQPKCTGILNWILGLHVIILGEKRPFLVSSTRPTWFCARGQNSCTFRLDARTDFSPRLVLCSAHTSKARQCSTSHSIATARAFFLFSQSSLLAGERCLSSKATDPKTMHSRRPKTGTYYLTYDNTSGLDKNMSGRVTWIGSSKEPWVPSSWTFHGPVAPEFKLTAGVSLLLRDDVPGSLHYAFIGNVNTAGSLFSATSADLLTWTLNHTAFARGRPGYFDHNGIAVGPVQPQPFRVSLCAAPQVNRGPRCRCGTSPKEQPVSRDRRKVGCS